MTNRTMPIISRGSRQPAFGGVIADLHTAVYVRALNELFMSGSDQSAFAIMLHSYIDVQVYNPSSLEEELNSPSDTVQRCPRTCRQGLLVLVGLGWSGPRLHGVEPVRSSRRACQCHHCEHLADMRTHQCRGIHRGAVMATYHR
jgi:hypothetical protein